LPKYAYEFVLATPKLIAVCRA